MFDPFRPYCTRDGRVAIIIDTYSKNEEYHGFIDTKENRTPMVWSFSGSSGGDDETLPEDLINVSAVVAQGRADEREACERIVSDHAVIFNNRRKSADETFEVTYENGRADAAARILKTIRAQPTVETADGWQPIDTAPKGQSVLIVCSLLGEETVTEGFQFDGGVWHAAAFNGTTHRVYPTRWRHLPPAAPRPTSGGQEG